MDPEVRLKQYDKAALAAYACDSYGLFKQITKHRLDVNQLNFLQNKKDSPYTLMHMAVACSDPKIAIDITEKMVKDHKGSLQVCSNTLPESPIHTAVAEGKLEKVYELGRRLIPENRSAFLSYTQDQYEATPARIAVMKCDEEMLAVLKIVGYPFSQDTSLSKSFVGQGCVKSTTHFLNRLIAHKEEDYVAGVQKILTKERAFQEGVRTRIEQFLKNEGLHNIAVVLKDDNHDPATHNKRVIKVDPYVFNNYSIPAQEAIMRHEGVHCTENHSKELKACRANKKCDLFSLQRRMELEADMAAIKKNPQGFIQLCNEWIQEEARGEVIVDKHDFHGTFQERKKRAEDYMNSQK